MKMNKYEANLKPIPICANHSDESERGGLNYKHSAKNTTPATKVQKKDCSWPISLLISELTREDRVLSYF